MLIEDKKKYKNKTLDATVVLPVQSCVKNEFGYAKVSLYSLDFVDHYEYRLSYNDSGMYWNAN